MGSVSDTDRPPDKNAHPSLLRAAKHKQRLRPLSRLNDACRPPARIADVRIYPDESWCLGLELVQYAVVNVSDQRRRSYRHQFQVQRWNVVEQSLDQKSTRLN